MFWNGNSPEEPTRGREPIAQYEQLLEAKEIDIKALESLFVLSSYRSMNLYL